MNEPHLDSLLLAWQEQRDQGHDLDADELCRDCPDLADELDRRIAAFRRMLALMHAAGPSAGPAPSDSTFRSVTCAWQTGGGTDSESATLPPPGTATPDSPGLREQVPDYELLEELGRGGMGVVYKARHVRLNRLVALKMILAGSHAGAAERARFQAEARAVAHLRHPGIVQIYEVGECGGLPFLALEFCEGGSLAARVAGVPLGPAEAARLVEQLARAVHAAHEAQVVHRDLKPANVLLTADGTPKVTDFGLAKRLDEDGQTRSGAVLGTPSYMAPEQAEGRTKEVGPATDTYALGAILYECLTGRPPFKAATSLDTILQLVSEEPIPPMRLNNKVPRDLETVCLKCLEKNPHRRYARAADLADDLGRFQRGEPVQARPIRGLERGWRWCRRNPAVAVSLLVVALSLLTATAVSVAFGLRAEHARQAEADRARAEAQAKQEAERARRDGQRQLIDLSAASGLTADHEGDPSRALLWFARAVHLASDEPERQQLNRIHVANWLRQVALPEGTFALPGFRQRQDRFRSLQFSPDGNRLLAVGAGGRCLVWDRRRGRPVRLPGAASQGSTAAWEPRGGLLAVAGRSGPIRLLAPPDFRTAETVEADGPVTALAFSRDGQRLAWGGAGGARVWDRGKKEYLSPLLAHPSPVTTLAFSASGELLATSAKDLKARVFRIGPEEREPLFPPVAHTRGEHGLAHGGQDPIAPRFAANDQILLTVERVGASPQRLVWRSATSGEIVALRNAPPGQVFLTAFAVSPDGNRVVAVWEDKGHLWDARTQEELATISTGQSNWCEDVVFTPDGKSLITSGQNMMVQAWATDHEPKATLAASLPPVLHTNSVVRANLSPDGRHLAAALWDGSVVLWRVPEGLSPAYSVPAGGTTLPVASPDGRFVLPGGTTYRNGTQLHTRVYEAATGKAAGPVLDPGGLLLNAAFSPDGARVATANSTARTPPARNGRLFRPEGKGGNIQLWDWKTGSRLAGPIPTPGEPRGLAFRPDGRTLAVVCADYRVVLVDTRTATVTRTLDPGIRTAPLNANLWWGNGEARFSPDGRFLVTWEMALPVHVWDPDSGRLLHTLPHNERVESVAFSPAAPALLATAGRDSVARVWDLGTGKALARLPHPNPVTRVRFSPDGAELFTSCGDGLLRAWDWRAGTLKDGLALHPASLMDFGFSADRRWLVTLGLNGLRVTDWRTRTPAGPLWPLGKTNHFALSIPAGDRRVVVGGFSGGLDAYDLKALTTPAKGAAADLLRLAELVAGRRILSRGSVVPLSSAEWAERWQQFERAGGPGSPWALQPAP